MSLAVLGLGGGPDGSQTGDIVWLDTEEMGLRTERLHTRFYYGTGPYYSLMIATRENVSFLGAFLAVLGLGGGPPCTLFAEPKYPDKRQN